MSCSGVAELSSGFSSSRSETATVPLVDAITMRFTPALRAASHSTRVPSTWTAYMRAASAGLRDTKPARW
jgi:hypothetical protein